RIDSGDDFPNRDLIIFLTFGVILASLVVQGLSFPALLKVVGLEDEGRTEKEENKARIYATEAALARLEDLADEDWVRDDTRQHVRAMVNLLDPPSRS